MIHLDSADYESITYEIGLLLGIEDEPVECIAVKKFCDDYYSGISPRIVLKNIRFNRAGLNLLKFILKQEYRVTKPITIYDESGCSRCKVTLVNNPVQDDLVGKPFFMKDLIGVINKYAVIDGLESMSSSNGIKLLSDVISCLDVMPIFAQAGYLYIGDYNSLGYSKKLLNLPEELAAMYESIGFRNVNNYLGNYEDSIMMLYGTNGDLSKVKREEQAQPFLKAVAAMSGDEVKEKIPIDVKDGDWESLTYYERGRRCYDGAIANLEYNWMKISGVKRLASAMMYFLMSAVDSVTDCTKEDKQEVIDAIKDAMWRKVIDADKVLKEVGRILKSELTETHIKTFNAAIVAYNTVSNTDDTDITVHDSWISVAKNGALAADNIALSFNKTKENGINGLSYYEQAKVCFEQASRDISTEQGRVVGANGLMRSMFYFIDSLIDRSSLVSCEDKSSLIGKVEAGLKAGYLDSKEIVKIISDVIKPGLTSFQCKSIIDAVVGYNKVFEAHGTKDVQDSWIADIKAGALTAQGLAISQRNK